MTPDKNNAKNNELSHLIIPVVKKGSSKDIDQDKEDLNFWLLQSVQKRAAAVTSIIAQSMKTGQQMDKSFIQKGPIKK